MNKTCVLPITFSTRAGRAVLLLVGVLLLPFAVRANDVAITSLVPISSTSLSASWTIAAAGSPTIVLSTVSNFTANISSAPGGVGQSSTTFSALTPNTTYFFEVKNSTESGASYVASSTVTFAAVPATAAFTGIMTGAITANWAANNNPAGTTYMAELSAASDFSGTVTSSTTANTSARFTGLTPGTVYYFRVKAVNHKGVSTSYGSLGSQATASLGTADSVVLSGNTLQVAAVTGGTANGFAYDPNNSNTVYASVYGSGLYKSQDDGETWDQQFLPTLGAHSPNHVLVSRNVANLVLVAERSGAIIWKSADGGANFSNVLSPSSTEDLDGMSLAEGNATGTFFASVVQYTSGGGNPVGYVYKSADSGATWTRQSGSTTSAFVSDLVQLSNGLLVMGTQVYPNPSQGSAGGTPVAGGIFTSNDEGATWTAVAGATSAVLGVAKGSGNTVMVLLEDANGIYLSSSTNGTAWNINYKTIARSGCVCEFNKHPLTYHAASDSFFFLTGNLFHSGSGSGGYVWSSSSTLINALKEGSYSLALGAPTAITVDPDDVNSILSSAAGDGIFKSVDGGTTWDFANTGLYSPSINLAAKSVSTGYIYAVGVGFVYFSDGSIDRWTRVYRSTYTFNVMAFAYDQSDPKRMYVSISSGGDNSETHLIFNGNLLTTPEDAIPFPHTGWQDVATPNAGGHPDVFALLADGSTVYAGLAPNKNSASGKYLYKSTDSAVSWQQLDLTAVGGIRALAFDPSNRNTIYAGSGDHEGNSMEATAADGLYRSQDGGATWTRLHALNNEAVEKIVIDTTTASRLWVLTLVPTGNSAGPYNVWESLDAGATWSRVSPENGIGSGLSDIAYIPSEGVLLGAVPGSGVNIYKYTPGSCTAPCQWTQAFGVYGQAQVLFSGSIGIGSNSGLFLASALATGSGGTPTQTAGAVRAYPNPFRPARGHTLITFDTIPANARIRVYTVTGEMVADVTADAAGTATWDAKNPSGEKVASGVYYGFVEGGGEQKTFKVVIQR